MIKTLAKPTVTIGIPAHNEGQNIALLLESIFLQQGNFVLKEIFVVCDGCTDDTEEKARSVAKKYQNLIRVFNDDERTGKVGRMDEMFSLSTGDVFVQLDADIKLFNDSVISEMISPIVFENKAGLTFANFIPLPSKTFIEKMMSFEIRTWERALQMSTEDADFHRCIGRARAFSYSLYKKLSIPDDAGSNEDAFSFLFAKENNYETAYVPQAIVQYRLPSTMRDYINQMARNIKAENHLDTWFKDETIKRYRDSVSLRIKLKAFIFESLRSSLSEVLFFFVLHGTAVIFSRNRNLISGKFWETIKSSKKL